MKIKLINCILGVLAFTFVLTGCSKNSDELASVENTKQEILTFANVQEFENTMLKQNSMKPEERVAWEKSKGFKSFGTTCDEFYKTIEPQNFKTIEEVNAFVASNSDKIQIYEDKAGDKYCEVLEFDNMERYLMNKDKMYIVGGNAVRKFDEAIVSTDIANIDILKKAKNYSDLSTNLSSCVYKTPKQKSSYNSQNTELYAEGIVRDGWFGTKQTYRLVVRLKAETTHDKTYNSALKIYENTSTNNHYLIQVSNYVWHVVLFGVSRTTSYDINLNTNDYENNFIPYSKDENQVAFQEHTPVDYTKRIYSYDAETTGVHIESFNVTASNDKNCSIDENGVY